MNTFWNRISSKDIVKAIEIFDQSDKNNPDAKNTFLLYNGRRYPAKHIRGIAYKIATGQEISKNDFSGGKETATFFKKLGFVVEYKNILQESTEIYETHAIKETAFKIEKHKIARLIVSENQNDANGRISTFKLAMQLNKFIQEVINKYEFEFLITPGGYLNFIFPSSLSDNIKYARPNNIQLNELKAAATKVIENFFKNISKPNYEKLKNIVDYMTIGIDGFNLTNPQHIELVAVYDLKKAKVIQWTGKFYPTESQKRFLIKISDLDTHFINLNNQNVILLGCHDLNVFSPRGQANAKPDSWKRTTAEKFKKLCKESNSSIILQHPHTTDTPNIWNVAWRTIEKELPEIKHYASGINYFRPNGKPRGEIKSVLAKTKKGDVIDFMYED
jgi:hypothetical protein